MPLPLALPLSGEEENTEVKQLGSECPHGGSGEKENKTPQLSSPWGNAPCEGKRPERPAPTALPGAIVCQPHNGRFDPPRTAGKKAT